tara:strand:+ start:18964 stop:19416 length:453 start_codon:yes stop_codon:yes gene_type:complete
VLKQALGRIDSRNDEDMILCTYAHGKVLNDQSRYSEAFAAFKYANDRQQSLHPYTPLAQQTFFDRHKQGQTAENLGRLAVASANDATPVFVLGIPRSDTTLVEQMLASHPKIGALAAAVAGEALSDSLCFAGAEYAQRTAAITGVPAVAF